MLYDLGGTSSYTIINVNGCAMSAIVVPIITPRNATYPREQEV
jgi:hypothetical protein